MASQTQAQKPSSGLLLLLLLLLGIGILALLSMNVRVNTSTQTASEGQCLSNGQDFDAQQEAFILAQAAEQHRTTHPSPANYGLGSYTICYKDGSGQRFQSPIFPGSRNTIYPGKPPNYTHSEQSVYGWMQSKLSGLSLDQSKVVAVYAVIFSQVIVCIPCQKDIKFWQRTLRTKAKTMQLYLSVWDIIYGKGVDPATYEAGTGTPVTLDKLRKVPIKFVP